MEHVLIVASTAGSTTFLTEVLSEYRAQEVATVQSGGQARRFLLDRTAELVVINAPLPDETGVELALDIAREGLTQVILLLKGERYELTSERLEEGGVLVLQKPLNRAVFWSALKLATAAYHRLRRAQGEAQRLRTQIEDIRLVDRAKWMLVSHLGLSEAQAHKTIEKRAMDMRVTKREVAEGILRTYRNDLN